MRWLTEEQEAATGLDDRGLPRWLHILEKIF